MSELDAPDLPGALADAKPFALDLRTSFRGLSRREGMLIAGPSGFGEFAPFDDYPDWAAARWLGSAIEAAFDTWPSPVRATVPCNAIIPDVPVDDSENLARHAVRTLGCSVLKVKVGGRAGVAEDVARIRAIGAVLDDELGSGGGRLRVDVNAAWDARTAIDALRAIDDAARGRLDFAEQPCATVGELAEVRERAGVRIAVDELVRRAVDPLDRDLVTAVRGCADVLVLKAAPLGGVRAGLSVAAGYGLPVVVSGSLDSSVGLAPSIALAAALDLQTPCGLGTGVLLATDLVDEPVVPRDGRLAVDRRSPDPDRLAAATAAIEVERREWWHRRLRAAWSAASDTRRAAWIELVNTAEYSAARASDRAGLESGPPRLGST